MEPDTFYLITEYELSRERAESMGLTVKVNPAGHCFDISGASIGKTYSCATVAGVDCFLTGYEQGIKNS